MNKFKGIIYGPPGCGKTTYIKGLVKIPECQPVIYIDFDKNTGPVRSVVHEWDGTQADLKLDKLNVFRAMVKDNTTPAEAVSRVTNLIKSLGRGDIKAGAVVVDSATTMCSITMQYTMVAFPTKRDDIAPSQQDYLKVTNFILNNIAKPLFQIEVNQFLLCHCRDTTTDSGTILERGPKIMGEATSNEVFGMYPYSGYVKIAQNKTRTIQWGSDNVIKAKQSIEWGVDEELSSEFDISKISHLF